MFINYKGTNCHALPYITYKPVKLKNKKTGKVRTEMRVDNNQSPQSVHSLKPGWNEFPTHIWKQNEKTPSIQQMVKSGTIEVMKEKITIKVKNKSTGKSKIVTKVIGEDDSEISLRHFEEKRAIEIVKFTWNRDLLQRWLDEELRHRVKKVLTKQLEPLLNNTTKDEEDDF